MGKRALVAFAIAGALSGLAAPAVAGAASVDCQEWNDQNTYGVNCTGVSRHQAVARCGDGRWYGGPVVTSGWSYVYCTGRGGNVQGGYANWWT